MKYVHGVTVGRYRPYHNGHLFLHREMLNKCDKITILLGSSQEEDTLENPFTTEEVKEMILNCWSEEAHRITISPIEDINNFELWSDYVLSKVAGKVDAYFCGSEEDASPFKQRDDLDLIIIDRFKSSESFDFKSGTEIREMIYNNNRECLKYIPKQNERFIRRMFPPI